MNTKLFVVVVCLVLHSAALAQATKVADEKNLYRIALAASLDKMAQSWGHINDTACGHKCERMPTDYRNMIVERNFELTDNLPSQFGDRRVEYLDSAGLIERYKKVRKEFLILAMHPMKNEGDNLKISITTHWFHYKKGVSYYAISDWSNVIFRFDCEKNEFSIKDVVLGGV